MEMSTDISFWIGVIAVLLAVPLSVAANLLTPRVPAFRIVEALDVVEYISSRLVAGPVRFAPHAFGLQRREEALHLRIVPDVAGTAHRTDDAVIGHQLPTPSRTCFESLQPHQA